VELLARSMGADPSARPVTATGFVDELERALAGPKPMPAAPEPLPPAPVAESAPLPDPAYVRHQPRRSRGTSRLLPVLGLLLAVALAVGAVLAFTGGSDSSRQASAPAKKHAKKPKKTKTSQQQAPATSQPAAPAPAAPTQQPTSGGYQVPQPAGTSAAEGARLNAAGKSMSDSGDYTHAIPTLEQAARSFPAGTTPTTNIEYAYTLFNLGHALVRAGRPDDAVPVLEERLKNPDQRRIVQAELDAARQAAAQG
jgi:tetratricopeptide (TPR) repeat protein